MEPFRHQVLDDFSPQTLEEFVELSLVTASRWRTWGVWRDEELGGLIALEPISSVVGAAHLTFKRSFWGHKTTITAAAQALDAVFSEGPLLKICGMVFADNNAVRGMYKRLGFWEEGVLKSQTLRDGKPVDVACCGMTKEIWNARSNSIDSSTGRSRGRVERPVSPTDVQRDISKHGGLQPAAVLAAGEHPVRSEHGD